MYRLYQYVTMMDPIGYSVRSVPCLESLMRAIDLTVTASVRFRMYRNRVESYRVAAVLQEKALIGYILIFRCPDRPTEDIAPYLF